MNMGDEDFQPVRPQLQLRRPGATGLSRGRQPAHRKRSRRGKRDRLGRQPDQCRGAQADQCGQPAGSRQIQSRRPSRKSQSATNVVTLNANTQGAGDRSVTTDMDVSVPRKAAVVISSRRGDVSVLGRDGDVEISSQHGDVAASDINGKVNLNLTGGSARISHISGDVSVQGRADDISVADVKGAARLNGEFDAIKLSKIAGAVSFKSARTDMEFSRLERRPRHGFRRHAGQRSDRPVPPADPVQGCAAERSQRRCPTGERKRRRRNSHEQAGQHAVKQSEQRRPDLPSRQGQLSRWTPALAAAKSNRTLTL